MRNKYILFDPETLRITGWFVCDESDLSLQEEAQPGIQFYSVGDENQEEFRELKDKRMVLHEDGFSIEPLLEIEDPSSTSVGINEEVNWTNLPQETLVICDGEILGTTGEDTSLSLNFTVPKVYRIRLIPPHTYKKKDWNITVNG